MAPTQSPAPPFFNFLQEGLHLPARNRKLFVIVFALLVASTSLISFGGDLAVEPATEKLNLDTKALNGTDPTSPEFAHLVQEIQDDTRKLFLVGAAYLLLAIVVASIVRIIVLFATVATYSGDPPLCTFGELLGKVRTQLKGPLLTLAFVSALEIAYTALLAALVLLLVFLVYKRYFALLFVESLVLLLAFVFLVYFSFVCSLSLVVAVAEPGVRGAGALARAWRLVRHMRRRALLFIAVTSVLATVVSPVHTLAKTSAISSLASGVLLEFVYAVLMAAAGLFAVCAMTAFYYEGKGSTEASPAGYVKLSTQDQISA